MPLVTLAAGLSLPGSGSYLDAWRKPLQAKSPFEWPSKVSATDQHATLTIGRLIAQQTDPAEWPSDRIEELALHIVLKSKEYKVSPLLVLSLIQVESSFRPQAVSPKGAVGLMQLMPSTAREIALGLGLDLSAPEALSDPKMNIDLGLHYIDHLRQRFDSEEHLLTAYNIGPAALRRKLKSGQQLPLGYYQKVMSAKQGYERAMGPRNRGQFSWL